MENLVNNVYVKFFVMTLSMLSPFIYMTFSGHQFSISSYWETSMQPLFIFVNASTSYYLFSIKNWWIPAFLLMLLTSFSVTNFFIVHNIFAIAFFFFCGISILKSKIKIYIFPYLMSLIPLLFGSLIWAEIMGILTICLFHFHRYIKFNIINSARNKI
jgi:hypothetical protein